jgi:hypothetical protein
MTDRYLGDGRRLALLGAPHRFKVGDLVFFSASNHTVAGEGMFIGRLKADPEILVVQIGSGAAEILETDCAPSGRSFPAEGSSWRRGYLKDQPGALV